MLLLQRSNATNTQIMNQTVYNAVRDISVLMVIGHVTRKDMIALNRRVMMAVAGKARQDFFWEELRQRYFCLQDEVQAAGGNSTKYVIC